MSCQNQIGIRNILFTFTDCDTGTVIGPVSHKLADSESLPTVKSCPWHNTPLTNGRIKRAASNASIKLKVIPLDDIPLSYYQGSASIDTQIEYFNGRVYVGKDGAISESDGSNLEGVDMNIVFKSLHEDLPVTAQQTATA